MSKVAVKVFNFANNDPIVDRKVDFSSLDYIPFGSDNKFPQSLALFSRTSPNHRGILDSKNKYMFGSGIITDDTETEKLISKIDNKEHDINYLTTRLLNDDNKFGNVYIEVITDSRRSFMFLNHIDASKGRKSRSEEEVIFHPDWADDKGQKDPRRVVLPLYPNFVREGRVLRSVYHKYSYEAEFTYYGLPDYIACLDNIRTDIKTNKWNLARLVNAFNLSGMLFVPVKDKKEGDMVLKNIEKNFTGEMNQGKLMTVTKGRATENEKADQVQFIETKQETDGSWATLHTQNISDLVTGHSWFRSLSGIADNTGFDTSRILNEYNVALSTTVGSKQKQYVDLYKMLYRDILNKEIEIRFKNKPPVPDYSYMRIWEIREMKGLDFDENDVAQQEIVRQ